MTRVIQPIFEREDSDFFRSTKHRALTMFAPLQAIPSIKKESEFLSYIANPIIDSYLETAFALDAAIHLLNATASFCKALYTWSLNQHKTKELVDKESAQEFGEAWSSLVHSISALVAQTCNTLFSIISLVSRPIVSVAVAAVIADDPENARNIESHFAFR